MTPVDIEGLPKSKLKQLLQAYVQAVDANIVSSITDTTGKIIYVNNKFCEVSKYSKEELIGQNHRIINSGYHPKSFFESLWKTIREGNVWHNEIKNKAKDGSYYWVDSVILPIKDEEGNILQYLSLRTIITDRKQAEEELKKLFETLEKKVEERTVEVNIQKQIIEEKNNKITNSIQYAKYIQNTIFPKYDEIEKLFPQSFVLNKPKDIVSGDIFILFEKNENIFLAIIDCTGHGVPGAFMSIIAFEKIKAAISISSDTSEILSFLNVEMKKTLNQSDENASVFDGMDIALCCINHKNKSIKFAGANRPLLIIRKNETSVIEIKGTSDGIGGLTDNSRHYDTHISTFQEGDSIYLFSDGYVDQFGGQNQKSLQTRKFKELLIGIQNMSMQEQKEYLDVFIENWKTGCDQIDDMLIFGIRF